ncbi:MAG: quinolinate synthase NadA [Acutalibacteraceae bacterium]|nr:quinolinate synthase NadA [Acutalibacteraceae bacterium]
MNKAELMDAIIKEKKARGITILAHTYQSPEIQEIADVTGDSYALSVAASKIDTDTVLMCGVRFMAETVKILSPNKRVILSHPHAGCPMAEQIAPQKIVDYKAQHPDTTVVAYINTTAELKAVCDVCVTSSSALRIVKNLPSDDILFIPDQNLGQFVAEKCPDKHIDLMNGCCPTHHQILPEDVLAEKAKHPNAMVAMHPECRPETAALADYVGSTSGIIDYINNTDDEVIIATERGVYDYIKYKNPDKAVYQLCPNKLTCVNMKYTTLQGVYNALCGNGGCDIEMDEELRIAAKRPIDNMLKYGG